LHLRPLQLTRYPVANAPTILSPYSARLASIIAVGGKTVTAKDVFFYLAAFVAGIMYLAGALALAYVLGTNVVASFLGLNNYLAFVLNVVFFALFMVPVWLLSRPPRP
jgi:hypothetical protein